MHAPSTPSKLASWIRELMSEHRLYMFYKSPEWKALRQRVLDEQHYECEDCRAKSPSVITPAVTVHHEKEVKSFPELALSYQYTDPAGQQRRNLFALCEDCHNKRHGRFHGGVRKKPQITEEKW